MRILLISDIHGNWPALQAVINSCPEQFDLVVNGGDTTVYAPFPNETIDWLRSVQAVSINGNTDRIVSDLLNGKTFKKPSNPDKRIMYGWTAAELSTTSRAWLLDLPDSATIPGPGRDCDDVMPFSIGVFHGSPADPDEFLFASTPMCRFEELARLTNHRLITVGHSHSPFHKQVGGVHFINPGSVGRMFDGKSQAAFAVIELSDGGVEVDLRRVRYPVEETIAKLKHLKLPPIYQDMYRLGRKLN